MSHSPASNSIPDGTYEGISFIDAVFRSSSSVRFAVGWRFQTPFGEFEAESGEEFHVLRDHLGLEFRGRDFPHLCALLTAAGLPGQPIQQIPDIAKLTNVRASVVVVGGKVKEVKPLAVSDENS